MVRTRGSEWFVRIQHPNGNWAEAEVVGKPTRKPRVNGLPGVRVPVSSDDKWNDTVWEEQPMEVYYQGTRQPIEQFERVERDAGTTELIGRGGVELRNIVDTEYNVEETTVVAKEVIENNTSYTANTDAVTAPRDDNVVIDTASTTSEFQNRLTDQLNPETPLVLSGDSLTCAQTCVVIEGENFDRGTASGNPNSGLGDYSDGDTAYMLDGEYVEYDFQFPHDIPSGKVGLSARLHDGDQELPAFSFYLDGQKVDERVNQGGNLFLNWYNLADGVLDGDGYDGDLAGGTTHTFRAQVDSATSPQQLWIDVVAFHDERFSYFFDNDNGGNEGYLDGPELYPGSFEVTLNGVSPSRSVVGGRWETSINDTSNNQALALSNDGGSTFTTANNTATIETDFAEAGTSLTPKVTFSRFGNRTTATPQTGFNGHEITDYTLKADLQAIPFVINQTLNDRVKDVLNTIASTGDFVWEFQIDDNGNKTVDFTQSKGREVVTDVPLIDYEVRKDISNRIEKIILFGGTNSVSREGITANHGTAVSLENNYVKEGSESVTEANGQANYARGFDYTISYSTGEITALAEGNITDGESLNVDYNWKVRTTASVDGVANPRTEVVELPGVTTPQLADNTVVQILREVSDLDETVDLTISPDIERFSAIDAINADELPTDKTFQIETVQGTPNSIEVSGGTRESLSEVTDQIRSQLRAVSRRS